MDLIQHNGQSYPAFQAQGNASQFAIPFALHFCKGTGYDIGFCKEEWKLPGARGIDVSLGDGFDANCLPEGLVDYMYSSHCLEHVPDWVSTLEYWLEHIREGGILFLYLPDISQTYWRPWYNRKHRHVFTPEILRAFLQDHGLKNILVSGVDLNNSFMVVAEK
jgi:hypothetical protein